MTYTVTAKRWEHGWELHIDGVGVTQSESISAAEEMVRDYLDIMDLDAKSAIDISYVLGGGLDGEIAAARHATAAAAKQQTEAAVRSRKVARQLKSRVLRNREVAAVLGVSEQRASQLLKV